jgi:hypothetical protein
MRHLEKLWVKKKAFYQFKHREALKNLLVKTSRKYKNNYNKLHNEWRICESEILIKVLYRNMSSVGCDFLRIKLLMKNSVKKDLRLVAISDNVDSDKVINDFISFYKIID